jgi:hypothetical protein
MSYRCLVLYNCKVRDLVFHFGFLWELSFSLQEVDDVTVAQMRAPPYASAVFLPGLSAYVLLLTSLVSAVPMAPCLDLAPPSRLSALTPCLCLRPRRARTRYRSRLPAVFSKALTKYVFRTTKRPCLASSRSLASSANPSDCFLYVYISCKINKDGQIDPLDTLYLA